MGFWGTLLGIGGDILGATVGMPWIGTAATALGNAVTGSDAASTAAQQQQAGAAQAAALQQPAMQIGQGALGKLGTLYGLSQPSPTSAVPGVMQAMMTGGPAATSQAPMTPLQQWQATGGHPNQLQPSQVPTVAGGVDPTTLQGMARPANTSSYGA